MPLLHPGAPFPEQCSTLPTRATSLAAGPAAPASAIPAPPRCCPATSPIPRTRWNPSRRRGAHLLVPARHRHRPGNLRSAMTGRLLLGRLRKAMRSADAARSRLDEVAVSPAIGPLPAIIVPVNRPIPAHPVDNPRPGGRGSYCLGSRRARSRRRMVSSWRRTLAATASRLRRSWSIWTAWPDKVVASRSRAQYSSTTACRSARR
jgi:hypothetical protein